MKSIIVLSFSLFILKVSGICINSTHLEINGRCLQFNNDVYLDWEGARRVCHDQGFSLASIQSSWESEQIADYVRRQANGTSSTFYWFGLHYQNSTWINDDGTFVNYFNWSPDFPDQYPYVLAYITDGKWITIDSSAEEAFLCSYSGFLDDTTTPGSTTSGKLTTISRSPTVCQPDDVKLNKRCYSFIENELSQKEAKAECAKIGKTLAVFDTLSQMNFITSYAQSQFETTVGSFWIGLERSSSSSPFYWQNEGVVIITNWFPGYPRSADCWTRSFEWKMENF
ncbi:unnamed protein product [Caenorhabditis angaria]|uniref:C-type lectin domain-containing protein n=1 Tax=Caenorhabditis angaria TaxID=860376 RepID=A0A9P1ILH4_9PELO|nr:unnamed protein product [Caenorhabditis angaria]